MWISILVFLASCVPSTLLFVWMFKRHKGDAEYTKSLKASLFAGLIAVLPIMVLSGTLFFLGKIIKGALNMNELLYQGLYTFIVLAAAEEIVKFVSFNIILKKRKKSGYSWGDVVAFMVVIGNGFGLIESILYAIGADPMTMIVRGLTLGHVGYAFIMGWFYGLGLKTGKTRYKVLSFVIPFLIHGAYDFSLTKELMDINELFMLIPFALAILDIVLLILVAIFFIRIKRKNIEKYNAPLFAVETNSSEQVQVVQDKEPEKASEQDE